MGLLDIGVSSLIANQTAIATTGNNIANANVEGYSRQQVHFDTRPSQFRNGGFVGNGVALETIRRVTNQFVTQQLRLDTASATELQAFSQQINQLDSLIANGTTGLSDAMDSFFASLQSAVDSPTSLPARQLVLAEAERLSQRYNVLNARLMTQSATVNQQISSFAPQISQLGANIANTNQKILEARSVSSTDDINELLDKREEQLRQLSELVSFTTSVQDSDIVNVFIGGGQALVLGSNSNNVTAVANEFDPSRVELAIEVNGIPQIVTRSFSGGEVGGLIRYRDEILDSSVNSIGLLAVAFSASMNAQHRAGIDLAGAAGTDFFVPINSEQQMTQRVSYPGDNALPDDRMLAVSITDVGELTGSDYQFSISSTGSGTGPLMYALMRSSDGTIVEEGILTNLFPQTLTTQLGFDVELREGSFQDGDTFLIRPTRFGAENIDVNLLDAATLALGVPLTVESDAGNVGTGLIGQAGIINVADVDVANLPAFSNPGELSPPLLVRFTSATTYDVLDNSDPTNPVSLNPPLRGQAFVPNQTNLLLPYEQGATFTTSDAPFTTTANTGPIGLVNNGYPGEVITVNRLDLENGGTSSTSVTLLPNESAATAAARINTLEGVTATANSQMLVGFVDNNSGAPLEIRFNGVNLTDPSDGPVPAVITSDYVADRINQLFAGTGISAVDTGTRVDVRSVNGDDLRFEQIGAGGSDFIQAFEVNGAPVLASVSTGAEIVAGGTVDIIAGDGITIASSGGIFTNPIPVPMAAYLGYQIEISGSPVAGDEFTVGFNAGGPGDNRNGLALVGLQTADLLNNDSATLLDFYGQLVATVGAETAAADIDREAAESLLLQTQTRRDSISGVNLDEEAAKLIEFEQAYNASAQIIAVARQIFDTLLGAFR